MNLSLSERLEKSAKTAREVKENFRENSKKNPDPLVDYKTQMILAECRARTYLVVRDIIEGNIDDIVEGLDPASADLVRQRLIGG